MTDRPSKASLGELLEEMVRDPVGHDRMDLETMLIRAGYIESAEVGGLWFRRGLPDVRIPSHNVRTLSPAFVAHIAPHLLDRWGAAGLFSE